MNGTNRNTDLEMRTKKFALAVISFVSQLTKTKATDVMGYQLLKAGTSVGANYREANRAESHDDFIHKIGIVEKEASETLYWLELFRDSQTNDDSKLNSLAQESGELLAIFTAIGKTAKRNRALRKQA